MIGKLQCFMHCFGLWFWMAQWQSIVVPVTTHLKGSHPKACCPKVRHSCGESCHCGMPYLVACSELDCMPLKGPSALATLFSHMWPRFVADLSTLATLFNHMWPRFVADPSTLDTLFSHMWPRFVADPSTLGRHVAATCMLCMQTLCLWRGRATACRTLEPQTAVCSPKLENNGFLRE